jgi:signal transduction histidine kinase
MEMLANLKEYYKTPVLDLIGVDLNSLLIDSLPFIKEKVVSNSIDIKTEFYSNIPEVKVDEEKLKSVILNLMLNAIDAVEENGKIEIKTDYKINEQEVCIEIRDNGCGIADKDLSRIFYPFYSTKSGGSGLGLAISSNIISAHKGRFEVDSEVNKGTIFKIWLRAG